MRDYVIVTDSTTDLSDQFVKDNNIEVIPFKFHFEDGKEYSNYLDEREMSSKEFYDRMRSGNISKTCQINSEEYISFLSKILDSDKDVLYISFSSGLSGSYNSFRIAKEELIEKYKDATILGIDSLCASMGEGLLVYYASLAKKNNMTIKEAYNYLEKKKMMVSHWFTVDDIETLRRGGRVSNSAAWVAKTLHIKPVLYVDDNGHLIPRMKKIGRKTAIMELVTQFGNRYIEEENETIMISHGDSLDDALYLKEQIISKYPSVKNVLINSIGPVIGSHSGPGTLALFFISKER